MPQPSCPTGNTSRFPTGEAAAKYARRQNITRRSLHGRFISQHCPDCDGFHVWTIAKSKARKRRPQAVAA